MKIIVDAMGGDNAPRDIVQGALLAAKDFDVDICLVGKGEVILEILRDEGYESLPEHIEISHASDVVEMDDDPAGVIKSKKDSSMVTGLKLLADGYGSAFVSAGSTGALLSVSTLTVKRIRGIRRAALAPIIPNVKGKTILLDSGANIECTPEYLLQFAFMGSTYASKVMGIDRPRVGLLNIGTEENKGGTLQQESYALLRKASEEGSLNFIGNVEGRDVMFGTCDVLIADGYSGNIFLKTMEGMGLLFVDLMRGMFEKSTKTKIAALLVQDGIRGIKKTLDYNEVGGAPLLGISKPVIKAHGSSKAFTLRSAIKQAIDYVKADVSDDILSNIESMKN